MLSKDLPDMEAELKESICETTNLKQLREIINKYTTPLTDTPYAEKDEIAYYFDQPGTIKDFFTKLESDPKYPVFSQKILGIIKETCPTSQCIVYRKLRTAKTSLKEVLKEDMRIISRYSLSFSSI